MIDRFRQNDRMEGRTLIIDGAEFADTREKLEADILAHYKTPAEKLETVKGWLDRQATITERKICEWWRDKEAKHDERIHRISELQRQCDELARAYKERGRIIEELREQLRNDDEPFCETVKRWLSDDAPEECIECEDGCWRDMHELTAERDEVKAFCERVEKAVRNGDDLTLFGVDYVPAEKLEDEKAENGWAREFLNRIGPKCGKPDCPSLVAYVEQLEDERDRMQKVIEKQAESFRKLEAQSAMPADCTECAHLDELRKLKRRIAKLARKAGV